MKTLKAKHIYDIYPIYQLTHGSTIISRGKEVEACVLATSIFLSKSKKKKTDNINVVEFFSGIGQHETMLTDALKSSSLSVNSYTNVDIRKQDTGNSIVGDAMSYVHNVDTNLVAAFHSSLPFLPYSPYEYTTDFDCLMTFMRNMYNNIKDSKNPIGFFCCIGPEPLKYMVNSTVDDDETMAMPMRNPSICKQLNLPENTLLNLSYHTSNTYDILKSRYSEEMTNMKLHIRKPNGTNGKNVAKVNITEPFVFKIWHATAVIDAAISVGFRDAILMSYNEGGSIDVYPDKDILLLNDSGHRTWPTHALFTI